MELLFKIQLGYIAILFVLNMNVFSLGQEIEAHGSPAMQTIKLLLHKRSRTNYNANEHESESRNYEECSVQKPSPSQNTIIKSSASIDNGAKYLSARNGTSSFECFNLCCKDSACDTSIYEDKGNHRCYLFHCNGLCKFKEHADYVVWALDRQARTPPPKKEEEELARLHSKPGSNADDGGDPHGGRDRDDHDANNGDEDEHRPRSNSNSEEDADSSRRSDESDRSKAGPATYGRKPNPTYVAPHTAGLSGFCDSDVSCEDPNAGCFDRACQCKKGFYNKNGLCREVCAQSDFECLTLGTSGRGPECIPKTKLCDSYMQCADGSDEYNCRSQASQVDSGRNPQQASSSWMMGQGVPVRDSNDYGGNSYDNMDSSSGGRKLPLGTQPVLQEGQHFQHKSPALSSKVNYGDKNSMQPERQGYGYQNNDKDAQLNSNTKQQQGFDSEGDMSKNQPPPSVRPINPVLTQSVKPSMNDKNRLPTKNNNNNQHVQGSFHNTNFNPAYPKPTDVANKANDDNTPNDNQNNIPRGTQDTAFTGNPRYQNTKSYSDSYSRGHSAPPQHHRPEASHPMEPNDPGESLTQHRNHPSNVPYSENGHQSSSRMQSPQDDNPKSSQSPIKDHSHTASHSSETSRQSKGRDGLKVSLPNLQQQRIGDSSKSSLTPSSKSPVSDNGESKTQPRLTQSSKPGVPKDPYSTLLSSPPRQPTGPEWLKPSPFDTYERNSGNQRQRPPTGTNQFYDQPPHYFSPYNNDPLDPLSPTILGDPAQEDFPDQFGNPFMDSQKQLNRMPSYPMNRGVNSGYMGYPESRYNSQYNPSRTNYGREFDGGAGTYQDSDFYSSIRNSKDYPRLYEDEQSGITKNKGTYPPGLKASTHVEVKPDVHKTKSTSSSDVKDADIKPSPATIPKGNDKASTLSHESTKNKTKQNSNVGGPTSGSKTILTTTKKPSSLIKSNSNSKVFVTHEKVIIASSTSEAEGPIIALSLGLAFTLILIGLLACRLRNMKHRLRKGRPLNSNEADYLINGMYL